MYQKNHSNIIKNMGRALDKLSGTTILMTGGTGYLGRNFLDFFKECLKSKKFEIHILSRRPEMFLKKNPSYNVPGITFLKGDLGKISDLEPIYDYAIHLAVDYSKKVADLKSLENLISLCSKSSCKKLYFASSGAVYGKNIVEGVEETYLGKQLNKYGQVKKVEESTLLKSDVPIVCARIFGVVGPYFPLFSGFALGSFVKSAILENNITIQSSGEDKRSFLSSFDFVEWSMSLLLKEDAEGAYNVGSEYTLTIKDLASMIGNIVGKTEIEILNKEYSSLGARVYVPSIKKIKDEVLVTERYSLEDSLREAIRWAKGELG